MFVIIFLIILSVLIFVHEIGHFLVAKMAGVKVEEFGFGYPPRAAKLFRKWDTDFTLNWIPFGGFVKILGENYVADTNMESPHVGHESISSPMSDMGRQRRFTQVSKIWQVLILIAGVTFNVLFAWVLFSMTFVLGAPYPADGEFGQKITTPVIMITTLMPNSPASEAGLKAGDIIKNVRRGNLLAESVSGEITTESISQFIGSDENPISFIVQRGGKEFELSVTPVLNEESDRYIIGIGMDKVGTLRLGFGEAFIEGAKNTKDVLVGTFYGMWQLLTNAFKGDGDLSQIAGPVGIVGLVKDATLLGFVYLLSFTAFISINLAIVNLIPFPALDGGRIVLVIIEAIKGSPVNPKIYNSINTVGFLLLIGLMLIITFNDIVRLF